MSTIIFSRIIEELATNLAENYRLEWASYGAGISRCPLVYLIDEESGNDSELRIILDIDNDFKHRQGIHSILDIDGQDLSRHIEDALKDGFDTIWMHPTK